METNPGPEDDSDISIGSLNSIDVSSFCDKFSSSVSFLHLNIQRIIPKLDLIAAEYEDFDILSFSESWLNSKLNSEKIWKIQKKSKLNSEKIWKLWKKSKLNSEKIWKLWKKSKLNMEIEPMR